MTRPVYQRGVRFASAGTKRLSNLLCSTKWSHAILEQFLWRWAGRDLPRLGEQDEMALAIWDESVLEKPGSIPWKACTRCVPARRPASSASCRATTIPGRAAGVCPRPTGRGTGPHRKRAGQP